MYPKRTNRGFSLIELLLVVVIVGLLSAVAVPSALKSRNAAEKGAAVGILRTMHTDQLMYFTRVGRYARLSELNTEFHQTFGTTVGSRIYRGNHMFLMSPSPTDASLVNGYQIVVYRIDNRINYPTFFMNQSGAIQALLP
ncbi:MAG: prepilin-type N-terminal cleavage/methylation domain-containing protein [Acidobacteria bacterium]|nr:prepilin-type N-terminal cleavage/methylation domain-containing protein [Acidobacteriota bacterium]